MQKTASNADKTATSDARTIEQDALVNHESSGSKVAQEPHYIYPVYPLTTSDLGRYKILCLLSFSPRPRFPLVPASECALTWA